MKTVKKVLDVLEAFEPKEAKNPKYQAFLKKFGPMAKDLVMLSGDEIF